MDHVSSRLAMLAALLLSSSACSALFGDADPSTPRLTLVSPITPVETDSVRLTVSIRAERMIERVTWELNGGPAQPISIVPATSLELSTVIRPLTPGSNQVVLRAIDGRRGEGVLEIVVVGRDTVRPALSILTPGVDAYLNRDSVPVSIRLTDDWGLASASFSLDGGAPVSVSLSAAADSGRVNFFLPKPAPGLHSLRVKGVDLAGNATEVERSFEVARLGTRILGPGQGALVERFWMPVYLDLDSIDGIYGGPTQYTVRLTVNGVPYSGDGIDGADLLLDSSEAENRPSGTDLAIRAPSLPAGDVQLRLDVIDRENQRVGTSTLAVHVAVPARSYTVTEIGTLGGADVVAADLNENGEVVGWSRTASGTVHAFHWAAGIITDIGAGLEGESRATGIAADGMAIGNYGEGECVRPFQRPRGGTAEPLGLGCGYLAVDINDRGGVAVHRENRTDNPNFPIEPAIFRAGRLHPLRTDVSHPGFSAAYSIHRINDADQVLSRGSTPSPGHESFLLETGRGARALGRYSLDLNEAGRTVGIIGISKKPVGWRSAWLTDPIEQVPTLDNGPPSHNRLNNRDEVAGMYRRGAIGGTSFTEQPYFWTGGKSYRIVLTNPLWAIENVVRLSDSGLILAHGVNSSTGARRALLLRPQP